jgi:probable HAF family extracellular repeat protein
MKLTIGSLTAGVLLAATVATAQPPLYTLTDLGPAGAGGPYYISANGRISGSAPAAGGSGHATLWHQRLRRDIGVPGLGGPNSVAFGVNVSGQAVGGAETTDPDPTGADFCGFTANGLSTLGLVCAPFLWEHGVMTALPTLGGNNGTVSQINRWGVAAGEAENGAPDPGCPEKLQFKPAIWANGAVQELPTYPGDPDAVAYAINDHGQVVGASGTCSDFNPALQLSLHPLHPILWQPDGSVIHIEGLGGSGYGGGNLAINVNNQGHVVGTSDLPGDVYGHAFYWSRNNGTIDLGTLPGDVRSGAVGINGSDTIVGVSLDEEFNIRAFVWQDGVMRDLNDVVRTHAWRLLLATSINDAGEIVGLAVDTLTGELHGYLASPTRRE